MPTRVYDTDSCFEMAEKIYKQFEAGDSCQIFGFVMDEKNKKLRPKGEAVLLLIENFYENDCMRETKQGKKRVFEYKENSIGGPIAHKIFTWNKRIVDDVPRIMIWRVQ